MKKVLTFAGCALMVAALTVACGSKKNTEEAAEPVVEEAVATEVVEEAQPVEAAAMSEADHQAMLDAAAEAGRAKCNCYKTDAASVESCIKSILTQTYAAYEGNEEFQAAMEAEYKSCLQEKATAAAEKALEEGAKAGAQALTNALKK